MTQLPSSAASIGIDLGGTKCAGVVLDPSGAVVARHRVPTPNGGDAIIAAIVATATGLRNQAHALGLGDIDHLGIGMPGLVTPNGNLRFAPHLFGVTEVPLTEMLRAQFDAAKSPFSVVNIENDNTAAAWAEFTSGAGKGVDDMVYVGFGTGIGGAAVVGGKLQRGRNGFAGELGHMVVDRNGDPCVCGRNGCWELYASGRGLAKLAGRPGPEITAAAHVGDEDAAEILRAFARNVALGLADLVAIYDPEVLVLGGGVMSPPEPLVGFIRTALPLTMGLGAFHRPIPNVVGAGLGGEGGAIGAARLALLI
jgi:glucokinase